GQTVARTQLIVERLDGLSRGQMPDARLIGNLANLVQVGQGNQATTSPESSAQTSPPSGQPQPVSSGTVSTPNTAAGMGNDWGSMLAQAVALANGDESNRPTPVNVGAVPSGNAGASSLPPPAPAGA